jgi:hypothetical protein
MTLGRTMSDHFVSLIPTDPNFVPPEPVQEEARRVLARLAPDADLVEIEVSEHVMFIDQGENFKEIRCPSCGAVLPIPWFQLRMRQAGLTRFADLQATVPCCHVEVSLNDLDYHWPAGFARFVLSARNMDREALTPSEIQEFERLLGTSLRVIYTHY